MPQMSVPEWLPGGARHASRSHTDGTLKKPDLILRRGDTTIVTEVFINWEIPGSLSVHHRHKVATYSDAPFVDALKRRYPRDNIFVRYLVRVQRRPDRTAWSSRGYFIILLSLTFLSGVTVCMVFDNGGHPSESAAVRDVYVSYIVVYSFLLSFFIYSHVSVNVGYLH